MKTPRSIAKELKVARITVVFAACIYVGDQTASNFATLERVVRKYQALALLIENPRASAFIGGKSRGRA